ncbi:MAG: TolC family protein [Candidatus Dadabacteria bacterium]|nr:TolC family protein [Candidatus Dadabacteria bacterium]MYA49047.1 TolC family protein [Candidatus Dadabacteria bacterium]MYK50070.1 TolC family protein [Candidatus Dadabacteria bacterium]
MLSQLCVFCTAVLLAGVLSQPLRAEEPHSPKTHEHTECVYNIGSVLTLSDAIQNALDYSPRIKSAAAEVEAAKGAENQAGYLPNPQIVFEAGNLAGSGEFGGMDSAEFTYSLTQTVEIGGKRLARMNAAKAAREASGTALIAERLNIERDVRIAYFNALARDEAVKLAVEQEQLAKDVLGTVSKQVQTAEEPEIQLSKAEVTYTTSIVTREREEHELKIAKKKLARLLGAFTLDSSLNHAHFFELKAPDPIENYRVNLARIPDMRQFSYIKTQKKSLLDLERARAIPDPGFSLGVRDFKDSGDQAFVLSVSLPIPVFNRNRGNIARARAEVRQATSDAWQAGLILEQQLAESWEQWRTYYSEAQRLRTELLPSAEKAFKLARVGFAEGKFSYHEVLDAQRTLFGARSQYYDSLRRYHAARANVERLGAVTE